MIKREQTWKIGDFFSIKLLDGSFSLGQIIGIEPQALNSVICAFYSIRFLSPTEFNGTVADADLVAVLFVTRDLLDTGHWKILVSGAFPNASKYLPLSTLRNNGFVGAKIVGSGIVVKLMSAYFGLSPWDAFYRPDFLDSLLVSPDRKPSSVVLKSASSSTPH
jgi:hypothetical protein